MTNNWQPIETGPKDGKTVLLGFHNKSGNWRTFRGQWVTREYIDEYFEYPEDTEPCWMETSVNCEDDNNMWFSDPTHWMSLPEAPIKEPS